MRLKFYRDRAKPIQIIFQCLSDAEKFVQPRGFDLVDREPRERGDLTIRDPTEPL